MVEFPEVMSGEPVEISATTFVTFQQCPERAAGRLRGVFEPESRAGFAGGLAHRIFARHLRSGPITPDSFAQACREEIGEGMNPKMTALGLTPKSLGTIIGEVGELYERFKLIPVDGFAGAELALVVEPSEGVVLKGMVDAVFSDDGAGVRLIDWKTGQVGEAGHQLSFYALLWVLNKGELPERVEAVSVRTGERMEEVPTRAGVGETARRVAQMVDRLREAWASGPDLPRHAGPWCRWCPLLEECEEGRAATALLEA
ncbi:MAG: PD-(D/E)XK nuclease family protein [Acidimicrobiia bacterium]